MIRRVAKKSPRGDSAVGAVPMASLAPPPAEARVILNPLNEMIVLAGSIIDWEAGRQLARRLAPETFLVAAHARAWAALKVMHEAGHGWDPETFRQALGDGASEVLDYVLGLLEKRPEAPPNLRHHVEQLEWQRARAEVAKGPLSELLAAIVSPATARERVVQLGKQVALALDVGGASLRYLHEPADLVRTFERDLRERLDGRAVFPFGIEGLDEWDHDDPAPDPAYRKGDPRLVPGAAPGKTTVVTASSGGGKSVVSARIALAQAKSDRRVVFGAWEMGAPTTIETLAAMDLEFDRLAVMTGNLTEEQVEALKAKVAELSTLVRFVKNPMRGVTWRRDGSHNHEVLDRIYGILSDCAADVFVADLWDRAFSFGHEQEERSILDRQRDMFEELGVHGILLQQQRLKDIEQRVDKRPTREGIKGSSAWVDIADTIIGVNIPSLWKRVPEDRIELLILKQRYGRWPLAVECRWSGARGALWDGATIPYDQPGTLPTEGGLEAAVLEGKPRPKATGRRGRGGKSAA